MDTLLSATRRFLRDEDGVTIVEYAMIAALIALGVAATVLLVRDTMVDVFDKIRACLAAPNVTNCT